eukprot:1150379-Pelagomonas_calceolata.AAC.4
MGGIEGEVDSPFNPARASSSAPSAGGDEVALQQNERVLNVRFLMNDDAQAQRVGEWLGFGTASKAALDDASKTALGHAVVLWL